MAELIIDGKTYIEKKITYKTVFTISMPNVGSWNGQWSGKSNLYCIVMPYKAKIDDGFIGKSFYYDFRDGWGASIKVEKIESKIANKMKRLSLGFMGYEWMMRSIYKNGCIKLDK